MYCCRRVTSLFTFRTWVDRKSESEETDSGDSDDDEEDENNSTDTDSLPKQSSLSKNGKDATSATANPASSVQFNAVQPNFYQEIGGHNSSSFQIQINLPPQTAPSEEADKLSNGQSNPTASLPPATHPNNDDDDYDT